MLTVARMLELSIASTINPNWQADRQHHIGEIANPVKRIGAKALHYIASEHGETAHNIMQAVLAPRGLEYLGCGVESSVYKKKDDSEVIKVNRRSINMPPYQKEFILEKKRREFAMLKPHLGSFMLDQTITVDSHPLGNNLKAVQTRQPYYAFLQGLELFTMDRPTVNIEALDQLCRTHPGIDDALKDFVDASFSAAYISNCLPDTNGARNLVVGAEEGHSSELRLIDTQPITEENHPDVQRLVRDQLAALRLGLQEVA